MKEAQKKKQTALIGKRLNYEMSGIRSKVIATGRKIGALEQGPFKDAVIGIDKVWGDHVYIEERTVDVHVKRLREALGMAGALIETVRGAGYRLSAQALA